MSNPNGPKPDVEITYVVYFSCLKGVISGTREFSSLEEAEEFGNDPLHHILEENNLELTPINRNLPHEHWHSCYINKKFTTVREILETTFKGPE